MIPGLPYSVVVALGSGRTSWTAVLDATLLLPGADVAAVTTEQIRDVVERLIAAGQWQAGDLDVLVVLDAILPRELKSPHVPMTQSHLQCAGGVKCLGWSHPASVERATRWHR